MVARRKKSRTEEKACPHCVSGAEYFRYDNYKFDVDLAREIVQDGRRPVELETDDARFSVDSCRIYPQHLDHVSPIYPGIIAYWWAPGQDGTVLKGHLLIDGHHRAARCLRDGLPFFVHLLTEEESRRILLRGPDREAILARMNAQPVLV